MAVDSVYNDVYPHLLKVGSPGRYVGGEYGSCREEFSKKNLNILLVFPDVYEIGMSNYSIKLLYAYLNSLDNVHCERAFCPAQDFEQLLLDKALPLYSLENFIPAQKFDIIAFSIGFELSYTNVLTVLNLAGIPFFKDHRTEKSYPIVIAGGSGCSNPAAYARIFEAIYIGEAEEALPSIVEQAALMKKRGASKQDIVAFIQSSEYFFFQGKTTKVTRAVWSKFGTSTFSKAIPVPNIKVVQDHGVIEIMRGCPNGCRFCQAGIIYRPYRVKDTSCILDEAEYLYHELGYRTITLSSLSSGDHPNIETIVEELQKRYRHINISLPSLKINSFHLPLLERLSKGKKSGLTFAIETVGIQEQLALNKDVRYEQVLHILSTAKERNWNLAKFYFMIGLPGAKPEDEATLIIDYIESIRSEIKIKLNINVGCFVPKPHTPFQWDKQAPLEENWNAIRRIKDSLSSRWVKVGFHMPEQSIIEGIIARGGTEVAELVRDAWKEGARFDSWEEQFRKDVWFERVNKKYSDVYEKIHHDVDSDETLPWSVVNIGVSNEFLKNEKEKSHAGEITERCCTSCSLHCGSCNKYHKVYEEGVTEKPLNNKVSSVQAEVSQPLLTDYYKLHVIYEKKTRAVFISHLALIDVIEKWFHRCGINFAYTKGFHPKPKLQFLNPLPTGFESDCEVVSTYVHKSVHDEIFSAMKSSLMPDGFVVKNVYISRDPVQSMSKKMLGAKYFGSQYKIFSSVETALDCLGQFLKRYESREVFCKREQDSISLDLLDIEKSHSLNKLLNQIFDDSATLNRYQFSITRVNQYVGDEREHKTISSFFSNSEELHKIF